MAERLGVREEPPCMITRDAVALGRGLVVPGGGEMVRDERRTLVALAARVEIGRCAAMEEAPTGERHLPADELARLLVAELDRSIRALDEQPATDELLERENDLLVGAAARGPHRVGVERPTEHGCGGKHLERQLAETGEPSLEEVTHAHRKRPVGLVVSASERIEVLHDEEREPAALEVQPRPEIVAPAGRRDELRHVGAREPSKLDHARPAGALCVGDEPPHGMILRDLLGPPARREEQRASAQTMREVGEQRERRLVRPVRVVDVQRRRLRAGAVLEELRDGLVEAHLRRLAVEWLCCRHAELGREARHLGDPPEVVVERRRHRSRTAHELEHDAVGEPALLLVAPHRERRAPTRRDVREQLVGKTRLADSGLADQGHDSAVGAKAVVGIDELAQLGIAAHEVIRRTRRLCLRRRHHGRRWSSQRSLNDRVVQRSGLVERAHAELAIEHSHAFAVLLHRGLPIADLGQQPDQLPVRRLVQRIERKPAPRTRDRLRRVARGSEGTCEPVEDRRELPVHLVTRELLPVVERGAVAEAEAGEERAAVERGRLLERLEAAGARLVRGVPVALRRRDEPTQLLDVEPDPRPRERDGIPPDLDEPGAEGRLERRERAAEGGTRAVGVGLGPEQTRRGSRVARGAR